MDLSIVPEHSFCVLRGLGQRPNKHETDGFRVNGIRLFSQSGYRFALLASIIPNQNNFGTTTVLTIPHDGGGGYHGGTESPQPHALGGADEHAESAGGGSAVAGISLYLILGIDEAGILQASKQSRLYLIYFPVFLTAGIPMAIGRIVF